MNTVFFIVCGFAVAFYAIFLIGCSRPRQAAQKLSVRKWAPSSAVDSAGGRRFLIDLEKEMAEFGAHHM